MKINRHSDEKIVAILREATATTVAAPHASTVLQKRRSTVGAKLYDGMRVSDVKELRALRDENARLKKLLAERDLAVEVMKKTAEKMVGPREW